MGHRAARAAHTAQAVGERGLGDGATGYATWSRTATPAHVWPLVPLALCLRGAAASGLAGLAGARVACPPLDLGLDLPYSGGPQGVFHVVRGPEDAQ